MNRRALLLAPVFAWLAAVGCYPNPDDLRGESGAAGHAATGGRTGAGGSAGTGGGGTTTASMEWFVLDGCVDGLGIQMRFFDTTNNQHWPSNANQSYFTMTDEDSVDETISCVQGDTVCDGGAEYPNGGIDSWGVGIDNTDVCDNCCYTCGVDDPVFEVTCN